MIEFVKSDPEEIFAEMKTEAEAILGRTLAPADPINILGKWMAAIVAHERVLQNISLNRNILKFADGVYLDHLADNFHDCARMQATSAICTIEFTLAEGRMGATIIPAGVRITTEESTVFFETLEAVTVAEEKTTATVTAKCQMAGESGNGYTQGQLNVLVDVFPYYESCRNITTTEGGADVETDEEFYKRIVLSNDTWSTAGPTNGYIYHAKKVSGAIADVQVTSAPGVVNLYILMEGGALPSETLLREVAAAVNADKVRPLTDTVKTYAPEQKEYEIKFTYYLNSQDESRASEIAAAVEAAVEEYKEWQAARLGRDINPQQLIWGLMKAGVKRAEIISPVYTEVGQTSVAKCTGKTVVNGGIEIE